MEHVGLVVPKGEPDRWAHRRGEPRGFAVLWMAFLLISTLAVFLTFGDPMRVTAEGYREGARMLVTVISIGITVMWPMIRLSQVSPVGGGTTMVVKDLIILLIPLQAVLWPQVVITGWTVSAVAASNLLLISWALIVGAFLAIALGSGRRPRLGEQKLDADYQAKKVGLERTFWMLGLLVAVLIGPGLHLTLQSVGQAHSDDAQLLLRMSSPLTAPWEMLQSRIWTGQHAVVGPAHWRAAWMTACLAVSAWILVGIIRGTGASKLARRDDSA
ncbi:MAG: hypothetical protein Phyf2KO_01900 [Phycisphaerales bacterium]